MTVLWATVLSPLDELMQFGAGLLLVHNEGFSFAKKLSEVAMFL